MPISNSPNSDDNKPWHESFDLSKVDVAKQLFDTAVELFFSKGDPVSTYLITASCEQILEDLLQAKGAGGITRNEHLIKEGKRKEYFRAIKKFENFFKHADNDSEAQLKFNTASTPYLLLSCCHVLPIFTKSLHAHAIVYRIWFMYAYPSLIKDDFQLPQLPGMDLKPEVFSAFGELLKLPHSANIEKTVKWDIPDFPTTPYDLITNKPPVNVKNNKDE